MINLVEQCKDAKRIGITGHTNPDGDCVGSVLVLWQFLKKALPDATVEVLLEKPAPIFRVLKGISEIISDTDGTGQYDIMIVADSIPERTGIAQPYVESAKKVINIDHHISNPGSGDVNEIDPVSSSTAELIYEIITNEPEQKALMDEEMAKAIYVGIIHDSGVMQYSNTSPKTLRIVAELIAFGFDFPKLIDETFYEKTYIQSQIMGRAILEAFPMLGGKCMISMVSRKTMDFYGAEKQDLSGIVNQLRIIKGVKAAVFMYEIGTMQYKVSLRSNTDKVDVAKVAACFGGGGHVRAAGCTMEGSFHDVVNNLIRQLAPMMEELE